MNKKVIFQCSDFERSLISKIDNQKKMLIDCDEIGVEYRVCSIGNGGLKQWGKFVNEDVQKCHIQIVELISGPTGRSNELLWIEFPKTLVHDEVFLSTFPKKERMINMKTGRMNKFTLKDIFQPLLLEKLRLSPTLKVGALFKSILPHFLASQTSTCG